MLSVRNAACAVTEMKAQKKKNAKERVCSAEGKVGQMTLLKREWRRVSQGNASAFDTGGKGKIPCARFIAQ